MLFDGPAISVIRNGRRYVPSNLD